MKKITILLMLAVSGFCNFFAKSQQTQINLWYGGNMIYERDVALIDSINFVYQSNPGIPGGDTVDDKIYVGVVAFNRYAYPFNITSNLGAAKDFILTQNNNLDFTALCYSLSKGVSLFDAADLPQFDKIFMLSFSDGTDNQSNMRWGEEGRMVPQANVYDTARQDLLKKQGLNSYAIGFGNDVGFGVQMQKLVAGRGEYKNATNSSRLLSTFQNIANSIIASSRNVMLQTNPGYYSEELGYKYFRFTFIAEDGYRDTITAKMEGTPVSGFTLTIINPGSYTEFISPASGAYEAVSGKVQMPLNNLRFIVDEQEIRYNVSVEVSFDGFLYYPDIEEASTSESISKRIAVVMVLDCSTSMGDAFEPMKNAAVDFISILEKMKGDTAIVINQAGTYTANGVNFDMIAVPGGSLYVGDNSNPLSQSPNVTLSDFIMSKYEVTQELWNAVMDKNLSSILSYNSWPGCGTGNNYPIYYVSWYDAITFCNKLSILLGRTPVYNVSGVDFSVITYSQIPTNNNSMWDAMTINMSANGFRLPNEAEWEYAARGGQQTHGYTYSGSNTISDVAWYYYNAGYLAHEAGGKMPNELGLYDMSGNVFEWCNDWYGSIYPSSATNPTGVVSGSYRVIRGGSWDTPSDCYAGYRYSSTPLNRVGDVGFRLVCASGL